MNTTLTKLSAIKRNPNNPRNLKEDNFKKLTQSIKDFPQMLEIRPIVVNDDMMVLGGNMRLKACKEAGLKEVPVMKASDLTEEQQREFIIKDNVGFGDWDWELLQDEWDSDLLDEWGLDLEFETPEDDNEGLTDEDDVPEIQEEHISKLGDIWLLGEHRLMCGDSTKSEDVGLLMNGEKADMVFTDPPYGVDYDGINNDSRDGLANLLDKAFENYSKFSSVGASVYCFHSDRCADIFHEIFRQYFHFSSMIIWVKNSLTLSQTDYQSQHEPCLYGWIKDGTHNWYSDRKQTSIWNIDKESVKGHTTPKPVEIISRAVTNSSKAKQLVLDLFLGSGSTLIGCEKKGRNCYGMELDPKYVDVIIKRWQDYTGKKAIHAETGDEFVELEPYTTCQK